MNPADLEQAVHRALQQLPAPRAPRTLLPGVLALVEALTARPWYRRAWFTWPLVWQCAAVAAVLVSAAGAALLLSTAHAAAAAATSAATGDLVGRLASVTAATSSAATAARVVWSALLKPLLPYAFALVTIMCLACAACGAALSRVAFGRI